MKHSAAEVVGVEGHGYINGGGGRVAAFLAVVEGGGLPKERELRGRTADEAKANDKHIREEPRCGWKTHRSSVRSWQQ